MKRITIGCSDIASANKLWEIIKEECYPIDTLYKENHKIEGDRDLYQFLFDEGWLSPDKFLNQTLIVGIEVQ